MQFLLPPDVSIQVHGIHTCTSWTGHQ